MPSVPSGSFATPVHAAPPPQALSCGDGSSCANPPGIVPDVYNRWVNITPLEATVHPPALTYASMAYDPTDQELILFGGMQAYVGIVNYTWAFHDYVWTNLTPNLTESPSPRYYAAMSTDAYYGSVVLFGGQTSGSSYLGDTWEFSFGAWQLTAIGVPGPSPRAGASFTNDPVDGYTVLFGGTNTTDVYNDTWTFTAGVWTQLTTPVAPSERQWASMAWDPTDGYILLFGGTNNPCCDALADSWSFLSGVWTPLNAPGGPIDRFLASMTDDSGIAQVLLFGGVNPETCSEPGDTWTFSNATWREQYSPQQSSVGPSPRDSAAMAYDPSTGYAVLFGGETGSNGCYPSGIADDTWLYGVWTGPPPAALNVTATASPSLGPAPFNTTLSADAMGGIQPYSFNWSFGDGSPSTTTTSTDYSNVTHVFGVTGNYGVFVTVTDAVSQTATAFVPVSAGSVMVPDWIPPRDTYQFQNYASYWAGGNCYGISATEILYWEHDILGFSGNPYLPSAAVSTSALHAPGEPKVSSGINATTLAIMEHQTADPNNVDYPWYFWASSLYGNWNQIENLLASGRVAMMDLGFNDLHEVVAYGEQQLTNGTIIIDISDPNVPLTTTHAWYNPNTNTFFYSARGLTWHGFGVGGINGQPEELIPSWFYPFGDPDNIWGYLDFTSTGDGDYFVAAGQAVNVINDEGYDHFTAPGDSQTFVQGIPTSSGIEEGTVQVYELPVSDTGAPPIVDDPALGTSVVQILTTHNTTGSLSLQGFSVAVDSLGSHAFTVQPTSDGMLLHMENSTNDSSRANVSFYYLTASGITQLNASFLRFADGSTANFTVTSWEGLDSNTTPSVTVTLTPSGGGAPVTYHLVNGQVGLIPGSGSPPPPSTVGGSTPFYLTWQFLTGLAAGAGIVAVIALAVIFVRKGGSKSAAPPTPPTGST